MPAKCQKRTLRCRWLRLRRGAAREEKHRHLIEPRRTQSAAPSLWLAFYAIAVVVVVVSNFHKIVDIVVAACELSQGVNRSTSARWSLGA